MKTVARILLGSWVTLATCSLAAAADSGTKDEAVAMVKKAAAFLKANGAEKTFAEIDNKKGQFVDRDLYVVAYDMTAKCLAHGANAKMIGRDLIDAKDVDGKAYMKERLDLMKASSSAWQNYKFRNPVNSQIEPKTMYLEKAGDLILGCGVYNK